MASAADYITGLQARGRYAFTTADVVAALGASVAAARAALRRLKRKAVIADPYRGFHVVVPPAYRRLGCLPAEQFIPELMHHLGEVYYVGLLSAAQYHGAAHQTPMVFQVIVPGSRRGLQCGGVRGGVHRSPGYAGDARRRTEYGDRHHPRRDAGGHRARVGWIP